MGKQLYKQGLRKCDICKQILPLTSEYFYRNRRKSNKGFSSECKECNKKRKKTKKYKEYEKRYNMSEKGKKRKERERQKNKIRRLKLRFQIFQRDDFTCQYCGRKVPEVELQVDHKYPKSKGGLDKIENYITACEDCNQGKRDVILEEF